MRLAADDITDAVQRLLEDKGKWVSVVLVWQTVDATKCAAGGYDSIGTLGLLEHGKAIVLSPDWDEGEG